jgi:hypothetical protein
MTSTAATSDCWLQPAHSLHAAASQQYAAAGPDRTLIRLFGGYGRADRRGRGKSAGLFLSDPPVLKG